MHAATALPLDLSLWTFEVRSDEYLLEKYGDTQLDQAGCVKQVQSRVFLAQCLGRDREERDQDTWTYS